VAGASRRGAVAGASFAARSSGLLPVFGATIFLSAALLFSVQPLFAKIVLPTLGGAPAVWSVALVFFQGALLAGYFYAHLLTRYLPGRPSLIVHLFVMLIATLALPLGIASGWGRPPAQGTEFWLLALFTVSIGLPFFALSANAPLIQAWFARTGHASAKDPYFLYAASNVGSFTSLLSYPFLVEPFTRVSQQTLVWSGLFLVLIALIAACAVLLLRSANRLPPPDRSNRLSETPPSARDALLWTALGAVPSAFLVAVTAHISTDVAAVPLLWVLPLALYLLSFVIVFQRRPIIPHRFFLAVQPAVVALLIAIPVFRGLQSILFVIFLNLAAFFVTAMVCHGELARRRPAARHLTSFYLWLAIGGVLGGIFSGLIAPNVFNWVAEYPLLIVAGILCRPDLRLPRDGRSWILFAIIGAAVTLAYLSIRVWGVWPEPTAFYGMIGVALLLAVVFLSNDALRLASAFGSILVLIHAYVAEGSNTQTMRSFFGIHKIYETAAGSSNVRVLMHGTTIHGAQMVSGETQSEDGRPATVTYFGPESPMARLFDAAKAKSNGPIRVAVVGLGAGTVACYLRPEDSLDFYEIDPTVVAIATDPSKFEFVSTCKPDARVVLVDARLTLVDAPDGHYDLIVMDAFSSDAVPVHLLTREAMELYRRKLAPGGLVGSHVMNRHLELPSVVAGIADANGMVTRIMYSWESDAQRYLFGSSVAAVARNDSDFGPLLNSGDWFVQKPDPEQWVWTDDYSNIVGALIRHLRN
jgi:spermidine synthase